MGHSASYPNTPTVSLSIKQSHPHLQVELSKEKRRDFLKKIKIELSNVDAEIVA
jgi:hypothetical protein